MPSPSIELARKLVRIPSVTPDDNGCQDLLAEYLSGFDFACEHLPFEDVSNLWAVHGSEGPLLVFIGHTDVVPTGPLDQWTHPPFSGDIERGMLHGRGAADMKSSVACFAVACGNFIRRHPRYRGSIALLMTSDEEGKAAWGTRAVLDELVSRKIDIDYCLVGEPTSVRDCGDTIKIGRRGALDGILTVKGRQGHIAYPHLASNPIHSLAPVLNDLVEAEWDSGNEDFPPTSFQVSNIFGGTGASNVIPGDVQVRFNFRYSPETDAREIKARVESIVDGHNVDFDLAWTEPGLPYHTRNTEFVDKVAKAVSAVTGTSPDISTSGGTSDGRFIATVCDSVVELGPLNATIHQIDECVSTRDIDILTSMYEKVLEQVFL